MQSKEKVPLRVELSGTEKYFYEKFSTENACDWLESFINGAFSNGEKFFEIISEYKNKTNVESSILAAIQKLIDTIREADNGKENRQEQKHLL